MGVGAVTRPKTIGEMTAEVRKVNTALGWRTGGNTMGDYVALLASETAEALEAFRDHRLADATGPDQPSAWHTPYHAPLTGNELRLHSRPAKPEGVGSELADVLIRLLDTGDVFGFEVADRDSELDDVADLDPRISDPKLPNLVTFGDHMAWLDRRINKMWTDTSIAPAWMLRALVTVAREYGIDLNFEYERKIAYNRTREYQHGGRTLSEVTP